MVVMQQQSHLMQQQFMQYVAQAQDHEVVNPNANPGDGCRLAGLRGLGGPPMFAGEHGQIREWMTKLTEILALKKADGLQWLSWAEQPTEHLTDSDTKRASSSIRRWSITLDGTPAALVRPRPGPRLGGCALGGSRERTR